MATYEDVLAEILYEVTNRPRLSIQALIAPLREVLAYEIKLEDPLTETEREAWLMNVLRNKLFKSAESICGYTSRGT